MDIEIVEEEEGNTSLSGKSAQLFSFTLRTRLGSCSVFRGPWAIFGVKELSVLVRQQIEKELTLKPFSMVAGVKRFLQQVKCFRVVSDSMMVPRAFFTDRFGIPSLDETSRGEAISEDTAFCGSLRDERQKRFVQNMIECLVNEKKMIALGSAEPGCGKTVMFLFLWSNVIRRKCLVVVHGLAIVGQWIGAVRKFCPAARVGIIHQNVWQVRNRDIVVASSDTLSSRAHEFTSDLWREFGIVCFDEAHHIMANTFVDIYMNVVHARYCVSLTGTPYRKDGLTHAMPFFTGPNAARMKNTDPVDIRVIEFNGGLRSQLMHKYGPGKGKPNESAMISAFVEDETRTCLIASIVFKCILAKRKVLVLCARNDLRKAVALLVNNAISENTERPQTERPQFRRARAVARAKEARQQLVNVYDSIHIENYKKGTDNQKLNRMKLVEKLKLLEESLPEAEIEAAREARGAEGSIPGIPEVTYSEEEEPCPWVEELVAGDDHVTRINKFNARAILATFVMAREALDVPGLDTLVFATPSSDVRQAVGRIRRTGQPRENRAVPPTGILDTRNALVIDIVDTYRPFSNWSIARNQYYKAEGFDISVRQVRDWKDSWE